MAVTSVSPVQSAAAAATAAKGTASSASQAFDDLLTQLKADAATSSTGGASGESTASADETEDRFLKLLVAQMKNQDPLNPLDNAQVTTQLAQINTVKGIDKLNVALGKLVDRSESGSATDAAAMVGRHVLVEGDTIELPEEGDARAGFELADAATSVRVEVLDARGAVVDTRTMTNLPAGLQTFAWDGGTDAGTAEPGAYRLRVTARSGSDTVEATPLTAAPVNAVVRGADGVRLQLGTAGTRPLDEVRGIL